MPLPTLRVPKHDLILPSNGKKIQYRPFVVGEHKVLLQAIEMKDESQLSNALDDIVKGCVFGDFDINQATVYDVEWILLHIRAKSVNEIVEMIYKCNNTVNDEHGLPKKCGGRIEVDVPLLEVQIVRPDGHDKTIILDEDAKVGMVMRDLPYGVLKAANSKDSLADAGLVLISECVDRIFQNDTVFSRKDFTQDDLIVFLEQLSVDQFKQVEQFIETMPFLQLQLQLRCPKCGAVDTLTLRGLDDFLR